jgi:predicted DNA binding CopG/RHH family protein
MIRLGIIIVLVVGLVGLAAVEQSYIQGTYKKLSKDLDSFSATIHTEWKAGTDIDSTENIAKITKMNEFWIKREKNLAMLARHADLAQVSDALIYIRNFVEHNIPEEACAGIARLRYLIDTHSFNVGTSIQNVI